MSQDDDKSLKTSQIQEPGYPERSFSLDVLKTAYIAQGLSASEISKEYRIPMNQVVNLIKENKLFDLRKTYIRQGISKIQNVQLHQAQKILDIEIEFKKLRLVQLETKLRDYLAYYGRHGDLYKRHPITEEILINTDGIPLQISVPDVARDVKQLKESVTLSDGIRKLLSEIDNMLNNHKDSEEILPDNDTIDMSKMDDLFKKRS